jgi:alpha-tubulin suppressor-like RCC1 family protein
MKAQWFVAFVLVLAISASSVVEAGAAPPTQWLSAGPGSGDAPMFTDQGHAAPGLTRGLASLLPLQNITAITAGQFHTCALTAGGGVMCWGDNEYGQLGDGTMTDSNTPVKVLGLASGVAAIAAGGFDTCALTTGGGVKCWGYNRHGELGDGTTTGSTTPVDVVGLASGVAAIATGGFHTCALTTGGGVRCWGNNGNGQLGDGTTTNSSMPVDVVGLASGVAAIATGWTHTCAVTAGGGVKCWGWNVYGQLGDGTNTQRNAPVGVVGLASGVARIAAGGFHTCALATGGGVKCWGFNGAGQLGDGTTFQRSTPANVLGLASGVAAIAAGWLHTCALTAGGGVQCWGYNLYGELGDGTTTQRDAPVNVVGLATGVAAIATGWYHTCARTVGGGVKCWGYNGYGQLGDGTITRRNAPVDVVGLTSGVVAIAVGGYHTCALTAGGGAKCWGDNEDGRVGDGTTTQRSAPVDVVGLASGVAAIAAGGSHTCALTTGGGVKCWGDNWLGQLGDGTTTHSSMPVNVVGLTSGVVAIATGWNHACALTMGGGVKCWGDNGYGQLGDGTTAQRNAPVDVIGLASGVAAIAAGGYHTCALTAGGVRCWGENDDGELGDGTTTQRSTPVNVVGLASGVGAIATGWYHTCALTAGGVKCWGYNGYGALGDGTTSQRSVPVNVVGLASGVVHIAAGGAHSCAVTAGGVQCWGNNRYGELGDGTTMQRSTPVDVVGLPSGVAAIGAGWYHTCVLTAGGGVGTPSRHELGGVKCFGWDGYGQLGLGTIICRTAPVDVITLLSQVYLPLVLKGLGTF